jgi:hypothetical protein
MQLALPEYNMGLNRSEWEERAKDKLVTDMGNTKSKLVIKLKDEISN